MLIRAAEIHGHGPADIRLAGGRVTEIGRLAHREGEPLIEARGGLLLPGLHDHHIHLNALAARSSSVPCGPPDVVDAPGLAAALSRPGTGWLRGIGYHESVMGLPDARVLDAMVPHRPLRIQHRSGRMWLLNTAALDLLLAHADAPAGLERADGRFTGRLFDADTWLRTTMGSAPPELTEVSARLATFGVTGVTDLSPANDAAMATHFAGEIERGALRQSLIVGGTLDLAQAPTGPWQLGPAKLHLHESALPDFDDAATFIGAAHDQCRAVAVHCVSEVELVFAISAFEAAGVRHGDRIEHVSVAAPQLVARMVELGLHACVQPHFIAERGDRYLADVEPRHHGDLYRLASLTDAGIPLAGGSDAPFGSEDPWAGMRAAVARRTRAGLTIGVDEALTPEAALSLWLADPADLAWPRRIETGGVADLVLLDRPWMEARTRLLATDVRLTLASGRIVYQRIDEPPFMGDPGRDAPA